MLNFGNITMKELIIGYIFLISVVAFVVYGIDKVKARRHSRRIPESTLLMLAAAGGGVGALAGIWLWHHKTRHKSFTIGVPAIIFAQVAIVLWAMADKY